MFRVRYTQIFCAVVFEKETDAGLQSVLTEMAFSFSLIPMRTLHFNNIWIKQKCSTVPGERETESNVTSFHMIWPDRYGHQEACLPMHVLRFQYVARNLCYDEHTLHYIQSIVRSIVWLVGRSVVECREQMQPNDNTLRIESVQQLQHAFTWTIMWVVDYIACCICA